MDHTLIKSLNWYYPASSRTAVSAKYLLENEKSAFQIM